MSKFEQATKLMGEFLKIIIILSVVIIAIGSVFGRDVLAQDLPSNHNELQAAIGRGYELQFDDGCLRPGHSRTQPYVLQEGVEQNTYVIIGNNITIRCEKWPNATTEPPTTEPPTTTTNSVMLSWVIPITRSNGSALSPDEIQNYVVYYYPQGNEQGAISLDVPARHGDGSLVTSHRIDNLATGSYFFTIATVDVLGNVSAFAEPVLVTI